MDQKKNDIEQLKFYEKLCFASKTEEDEVVAGRRNCLLTTPCL